MATLTTHEQQEIDRANASGLQPVVFVHGLWLLSSSWDNWRQLFEANGYTTLAPGWPDDPETVAEANEDPEVFAHKRLRQITGHYLEAIGQLAKKPAVVGHSFGGLISMMIAGQGVAAVTVAISPAPFRGVLPLPFSALKSSSAVLANPANYNRAVALTYEQFHYGFTNAVDEDEAHKLYDTYAAPGAGAPIFQAATANVNPWTEDQVDTSNPERGPLLIISSDQDHTVPFAIANAAYKRQVKNPGITEIKEMSDRGHSLTIDHGWREVAETALAFVTEHTPKDQ
ncbi:MAG TPA: alpha/beta hydrolase [Ktedonobacterales bacterium]|jgi:pimeloyl-ACP methyl ester carboxylesterase|nr:alpha/beta hydrolase [Ktedonobacterales bacterium]